MYQSAYNVTWWPVSVTIFAMEKQNLLPFPVESCHRMGSLCTTVELKIFRTAQKYKIEGGHVKCPRFLSDFKQIWIVSTDFRNVFDIKFSEYPSSGGSADACGHTDGRTGGRT
jgi:hypothetical protein